MSGRIEAEGLKELRRDFKRAGDSLPREIGNVNKQFVTIHAVPAVRARAAGRTPRVSSKAIASIRGLGSQTRAQIAGGSNRAPEFAGHNYGSNQQRRTARGGHTTQFPVRAPRRGRGNFGYILEQGVEAELPRLLTAYERMLVGLLEVRG